MANQQESDTIQQTATPTDANQQQALFPQKAPSFRDRIKKMTVPQVIAASIALLVLLFFAYQQTFARYWYVQRTYKAETTVARQILSTYKGIKTIEFNDYNDTSIAIGMPPTIYYRIDVNGIPGQWGYGTYKEVQRDGNTVMDFSDDWEPDKPKQLEGTGLAKRKQKIKVTDAMLSRVKITYRYNWYLWY